METSSKRIKRGFTEIINREMDVSPPKSFSRHFSASEIPNSMLLVDKINLYGELNGHEECVNTVEFNSTGDLLVRLGEILENGQVRTRKLGEHQGRVHNLAVDPGSPHIFYSSGEDGLVQHFDLRSSSATKLFHCFSFEETNRQAQPLKSRSKFHCN
ncbi:hypothetical protein QQP08_027485 [Theobroma cacao]|nr:hypothetical protein QQP08_027485 [Theobroma cacao]